VWFKSGFVKYGMVFLNKSIFGLRVTITLTGRIAGCYVFSEDALMNN
jgi:hypothetical protein